MRSARRRRRGWTLIELIVAVSALAVLMTIMATLMIRLMKLDRAERSRVVVSAALERLARDLRGDARAATAAAEVGGSRLVLPMADGRSVEYAVRGGRDRDVLRTVRRGGKDEHYETYRRPPGTTARFESGRDGTTPLVALAVAPDPGADPSRPADPVYRDYRIEAAVGRDARPAGRAAP